jgi:hypothetical protein
VLPARVDSTGEAPPLCRHIPDDLDVQRWMVSDELWMLIEPLLPVRPPRRGPKPPPDRYDHDVYRRQVRHRGIVPLINRRQLS